MKNMFLKNAFVALTAIVLLFASCKSDDPKPAEKADFTALNELLVECNALVNTATTTDYPQAAIDAFRTAISTATIIAQDENASQTAVDNAVTNLEAAKRTFLAAAYGAIPEEALLLGLTFDETITDGKITTAGKGWTAILTAGPSQIFGTNTAIPTIVDGRQGKGKAMRFERGSHLEIYDYAANDLLGNKLSIALWINPDSIRENNYIASYNYWQTWKFQLQTTNRPFFTMYNGNDYVNQDGEFELQNKSWAHIVVTLDLVNKKLAFYANGVLTKEWDSTSSPNLTGSLASYNTVLPLLIGAGFPYSEGMATMGTESWWQTETAFPHFVGLMDEFKLYNIALDAGQVNKLYNDEK